MTQQIIRSALKDAVHNLPDDTVIKPQALPNMLKKAGVTQDELTWSRVEMPTQGSDPKGRLTKDDLVSMEEGRRDLFNVEDAGRRYETIAPAFLGRANPNYREKAYTLDVGISDPNPDLGQGHYGNVSNYQAHTRVSRAPIGGMDAHVVLEIQSDLYQEARQHGVRFASIGERTAMDDPLVRGAKIDKAHADIDEIETLSVGFEDALTEEDELALAAIEQRASDMGWDGTQQLTQWFEGAAERAESAKLIAAPIGGPFEDRWMRKVLENEVAEAIDSGREAIAVPIKGNVDMYKRSSGVQADFYERQVVQTMQKLARQMDAEFEMVTEGLDRDVLANVFTTGDMSRLDMANIPESLRFEIQDAAANATVLVKGDPLLELLGMSKNLRNYALADKQAARVGEFSDLVFGGHVDEDDMVAMAANLGWTMDKGSIDDWIVAVLQADQQFRRDQVPTVAMRTMADYNRIDVALPAPTEYAVIRPKRPDIANDVAEYENSIKQFNAGLISRDELAAAADVVRTKHGLEVPGLTDTPSPTDFVKAVANTRPEWKRPQFNLYSSPSAIVVAAGLALQQYSEREVAQYLTEEGYDPQEIMALVKKREEAIAAGYSEEEVTAFIDSQELTARKEEDTHGEPVPRRTLEADLQAWTMHKRHNKTQNIEKVIQERYGMDGQTFERIAKSAPHTLTFSSGYDHAAGIAYDTLVEGDLSQLSVQDVVGLFEVVRPTMTSLMTTTLPAMFGQEQAVARQSAASQAQQNAISMLAQQKFGLNLQYDGDDWIVEGPNGPQVVTPDFWDGMKNNAGMDIGATAGAIAGSIAGYKSFPQALPLIGKLSKPLGAMLYGMGGGVTGAVLGTEYDYMQAAMKLHMDMEAEVAAAKAMSAAELAMVGEIIGYPVARVLGLGWKGVLRAKNMVMDGNTQGAYQALKDVTFLDDNQIAEIVGQFEALQGPLTGTMEQKSIQAVTMTQPGLQNLMSAAASYDPQAGRAVQRTLTERAGQLIEVTGDLTNEQVARQFVGDLQNYRNDVKTFYGKVKNEAIEAPAAANFSFDYDELMIEPVLDTLYGRITDPAVRERFILQADRVRGMSESRTLGDLIELRQITNDFLFNRRVTKMDDQQALRGVIAGIDAEIERGASEIFPDPDRWIDQWAEARSGYAQMKSVEKSAMYRLIFDKGGNVRPVQPESVVRSLAQHITSLDGSFDEVMTRLPLPARKQYEGAVVDYFTEKFTVGIDGGLRAVRFPELAAELDRITFTTPGARAGKLMIQEMAEVFKNDVYLAAVSTPMPLPQFQSYLTVDPVVRAQFEVASGIFNTIKTWAPTQKSRNVALTKQVALLFEKPLNVRNMNELAKEFATDNKMMKAMRALQEEAVRMASRDGARETPHIKVFGEGRVRTLKGEGSSETIPGHRIADLEQVKQIADAEGLTMESKLLDAALAKYGYKAVMQGTDRVRLLGDLK